jgi:D-beta-D-heptose 7-phosphate kinase/D-beta-D-heptose 1-phosphate adenosyltransferase
VGVIGSDNSGKQLYEIIKESDFSTDGVVIDASRPTTVKTRVIAHNQHVVRIDRESRSEISYSVQNKILDVLTHSLDAVDAIIIEDYNKGVIVSSLITQLVQLARQHGKCITVDPKFNNFFDYRGVTVFKPNRKEAEEVLGTRLRTDEEIQSAGRMIREKLDCENVLLTLGEQGMALFRRDGSMTSVATLARKVLDVSGAGDTVISTLTMALAGGADINEAATLANAAGGVVCGYVGIVPIDRNELKSVVLGSTNHHPTGKSTA